MILLPFISSIKISLLAFGLISFATQANAKVASNHAPVNIKSRKVLFQQDKGKALYSGEVSVLQGERKLYSDNLEIEQDANNKIKVIIATGSPAKFIDSDNNYGTAKTIKYYPQEDKVDLIDNASITQDGDTVDGPFLNYDFSNSKLTGESNDNNRPVFTLQPKRAN